MHGVFLFLYRFLYERIARGMIFRHSASDVHQSMLNLLTWLDAHPWTHFILKWSHDLAFSECPLDVGGVRLLHPLILAAGFVKGEGFTDETSALQAVSRNIIPGWRSIPLLVGAVEFGSFTRHPRIGNPGTVLWRDEMTLSTQNRVGLKNPGAIAAAEFLSRHRQQLPPTFGINIAVSPGITDPEQECRETLEAFAAFADRGVLPTWFTLNLSCPNTDDDPGSHQTEARARNLCSALVRLLQPYNIPLWVKLSPGLADEQYSVLLRTIAEISVRAVIATNTLGAPAPDGTIAGIAGGRLHAEAVNAVAFLCEEKKRHTYNLDIIACGGVQGRQTYQAFVRHGVQAMQYWSALVYRGPLAAAVIEQENTKP